jgi:putative beta-1,4-xylosyltransferase IRX10
MLKNVRSIWQRFVYRDSILLEAARQRELFSKDEAWAVEFSKLGEDDVFATFIQVEQI